jgi:hypothetical protein
MFRFLRSKLLKPYIWKRIYNERLTEPLHLNIIAAFVAVFGGFRAKVEYDLVLRCQHAFGLLQSADLAKSLGHEEVTVMEFGVAAGAGLLNICEIAGRVTRETGVKFRVVGFDTGRGMPPPQSYRDHPELYQEGDFPMDVEALRSRLPAFAELIIGDIAGCTDSFLGSIRPSAPIGFISIDVDYYSSARAALSILCGSQELYLPRVLLYLDDLEDPSHNSYCGEQLAVREFNEANELRKIEAHQFLRLYRIFKNARWVAHMLTCHVLDHDARNTLEQARIRKVVLENPYL